MITCVMRAGISTAVSYTNGGNLVWFARLFRGGNLVFSRDLGLGIGIAVVRSDVRFYSYFLFGGWSKKRVTMTVLRTDVSQGSSRLKSKFHALSAAK